VFSGPLLVFSMGAAVAFGSPSGDHVTVEVLTHDGWTTPADGGQLLNVDGLLPGEVRDVVVRVTNDSTSLASLDLAADALPSASGNAAVELTVDAKSDHGHEDGWRQRWTGAVLDLSEPQQLDPAVPRGRSAEFRVALRLAPTAANASQGASIAFRLVWTMTSRRPDGSAIVLGERLDRPTGSSGDEESSGVALSTGLVLAGALIAMETGALLFVIRRRGAITAGAYSASS
jgi:hypothetical protein